MFSYLPFNTREYLSDVIALITGPEAPYPLRRDNQKAGADARALYTGRQRRRQERRCLYLEDSPGDRRL